MDWKKKALAAIGVVGLGVVGVQCLGLPCASAWMSWGMVVDECPDGEPRVEVSLNTYGIERNRSGNLTIDVDGVYVTEDRARPMTAPLGDFDAQVTLVVGEQETPVECHDAWDDTRGLLECRIELDKDIPDGDHTLRVHIDTPLEDPVVDLDLPLYRPSIVHVLTDRPLYEGGHTIQFRALVLRAGSLEPIDNRPGTWTVQSPDGATLLEERSDGGAWGISASTFPLADDATTGTWTVSYTSGNEVGSATVKVEPFTLPRMTATLLPDDPWYAPGEDLVLRGTVSYASGAPVQGAAVALDLRGQDAWPPPREWFNHETVTDADGGFTWELGPVPEDIVDVANLSVSASITDTDGDRVTAGTGVVLSERPILAEAVTDVPGGMVPELNNRVYLRLTTPDGRALGDEEVFVKNSWDSRDEGRTVDTDADGVAALQLDPGQPVSITIPAQPVRPVPLDQIAPFAFKSLSVFHAPRTPSILEQTHAKEAVVALETCGFLNHDANGRRELGIQTRAGRIVRVSDPSGDVACFADVLVGRALGDATGVYALKLQTRSPRTTSLSSTVRFPAGSDPSVVGVVQNATRHARRCIESEDLDGAAPFMGLVHVHGTAIDINWQDSGRPGTWENRSCVQSAFSGLELTDPATEDLIAVLELSASSPRVDQGVRPQPTVTSGFEYEVSIDGLGSGNWRSWPGVAPNIRLRPDRVLLDPGDTMTVEVLRGPDYTGDLPGELELWDADGVVMRCARTAKVLKAEPYDDYYDDDCPKPSEENTISFLVRDEGFHRVAWNGAQTVVYARPKAALSIDLSTDAASYAPGNEATLTVQASSQAVVSLIGIDARLGDLAPLPGAAELSDLSVGATSFSPAWGTLDALALTSGQVRGDNAAMAAVLRVDTLTGQTIQTPYSSLSTLHQPPIRAETQTAFWDILADLGAAVRGWESTAETDALLTNEDVARMFDEVLDARAAAGTPILDPFGRRPRLTTLPEDLLVLCDPRLLVRDATHLPEDVQAWTTFVAEMDR
ncbi:MAG: hypothetical protein GY913_20185 [Proteobacteria bacterium]|nr:hypothetical protein [Pseudomonadota bacterium]MCP4919226.1 hypothetical protein [Pseudomonadota bacterium]